MEELVDVSVTGPDAAWLADLTRSLVDARLAACGNITESVWSIYRWEGQVEDDTEALVVLHTRRSLASAVIDHVRAVHPYDTAQVLAVPVMHADPDYHQWVLDATRAPVPE